MVLSHLISGFGTSILPNVTCTPCPTSLFHYLLPSYSSIHLKDTQQVDAKYKKDQLSQTKRVEGWKKGLINYAGHDFRLLKGLVFCKMNYCKKCLSVLLKWILSIWEPPVRVHRELQNLSTMYEVHCIGFLLLLHNCMNGDGFSHIKYRYEKLQKIKPVSPLLS